jgi:hypothetical protein
MVERFNGRIEEVLQSHHFQSGEQDTSGAWHVDATELARVYKRRDVRADKLPGKNESDLSSMNRGLPAKLDDLAELQKQLAEAEKRAAVAEALAEERAQRIEDLRRLLPASGEGPGKPRRWWLFG